MSSDKKATGRHAQSIDSKVARRIYARKAGWVFTSSQFVDLGSPDAVRKALARQVKSGKIRHLALGLWRDQPLALQGREKNLHSPPGLDETHPCSL